VNAEDYARRLSWLAEAAWSAGLHEHAILSLQRLLEHYGIDTEITDEIPVATTQLVRPYVQGTDAVKKKVSGGQWSPSASSTPSPCLHRPDRPLARSFTAWLSSGPP
jgi:hypothetical protein